MGQRTEKTGRRRNDHGPGYLQKLAEAKPGLIERRVNAATKSVFDELEEVTDPNSYIPKPGREFLKEEE